MRIKSREIPVMAKERISIQKRTMILGSLFEGLGVNATKRITHTGKDAILRFLVECAEACEDWHNRHFTGLSIDRLEIDEQWSFVKIHRERMTPEERAENRLAGDCWLWACIDPKSKAMISWKTAKRSMTACHDFSKDIAARVTGNVQITSDALSGYRYAIPSAFGPRASYATERKEFHHDWKPDANYLKKRVDPLKTVVRRAVKGKPDLNTVTTCHVERLFLTTRQQNKRLGRMTLGYSKKWDNHAASNSVFAVLYNLTRRHESINRLTPAQALGITDRAWTLEDVVVMVDAYHAQKHAMRHSPAFTSRFTEKQRPRRVYQPVKPKTPWYLDKDSGGKDCPPNQRKPGIDYTV
jgi:IS1 family transposase